jgi:hypothetical protein
MALTIIGNRKYARSGGDSGGANLPLANYKLNRAKLNQYRNRSTPGSAVQWGEARLEHVVGDARLKPARHVQGAQ